MSFTRRHERELAEIKALHRELDQRAAVALEQIDGIQTAYAEVNRKRFDAHDLRQSRSIAEGEVSDPLLVFVHVPKTAGATVKSMLVTAYSNAAVRDTGNYMASPETTLAKVAGRGPAGWDQWCRRGGRVTIGHVPYGVYREHLPASARYMTFLREPVDRVVSHYYRHRAKKPGRRAQAGRVSPGGKITTVSLEEALAEPALHQLSNLATRLLCGHPAPLGELPASALDDAKANLREFAFVGIQERFEESIVLLQRMLGLDRTAYEDRHVSSDRPAVEEISDKERALIEERNQLDSELYRFALGLFEDAVAEAGDGLAADVEWLQDLATATGETATPRRRDEGRSKTAPEGIREVIDGLAARYELPQGRADALQGLVGMVDWENPNYVPGAGSREPEHLRRRRRRHALQAASNLLAESLAGLELEPVRRARHLVDIGSGAGFPGLVLAIALPHARVTLIEKVPERCSFLRRASRDLGVDNAEVVEGSFEDWSQGVGACDVVTSRKVGRLNTMVERCAPFLAPGGALALWPGARDFPADAQVAAAEAAEAAGMRLAHVHAVSSTDPRGEPAAKSIYLFEKSAQ